MASTRRLAAILAADVAGYSRLMGADEEGTHERLRAHLNELVDPKIEAHRGRTVKHTGDGVLAEFPSVLDAVRCAVEVQRGMIDREPEVLEERRIRFRIGVNLGDVIAEDDDIFGDGVNVAARLEALAAPGGLCISRMVHDQIRDKLPYPFDDMGEQNVKNIARPVHVYALRPETIADLPASTVATTASHGRHIAPAVIRTAAAAVLVIAGSAWWLWPTMKSTPTPAVAGAPGIKGSPERNFDDVNTWSVSFTVGGILSSRRSDNSYLMIERCDFTNLSTTQERVLDFRLQILTENNHPPDLVLNTANIQFQPEKWSETEVGRGNATLPNPLVLEPNTFREGIVVFAMSADQAIKYGEILEQHRLVKMHENSVFYVIDRRSLKTMKTRLGEHYDARSGDVWKAGCLPAIPPGDNSGC
jgi:class 3 adenylate cyclase